MKNIKKNIENSPIRIIYTLITSIYQSIVTIDTVFPAATFSCRVGLIVNDYIGTFVINSIHCVSTLRSACACEVILIVNHILWLTNTCYTTQNTSNE